MFGFIFIVSICIVGVFTRPMHSTSKFAMAVLIKCVCVCVKHLNRCKTSTCFAAKLSNSSTLTSQFSLRFFCPTIYSFI